MKIKEEGLAGLAQQALEDIQRLLEQMKKLERVQ